MKSVVNFSIKQRVFINVVFVILTIAGAFSLYAIPVENMPMVDIGKVFIQTVYYGAPADDVEQLVTKKIEDALDSLENVEFIQSSSYRGYSAITVKFIDDTDYRDLYDELRFRVLNIKEELPAEAEDPRFVYIDTAMWLPVVTVNLMGDMPQRSLKLMAEELKTRLFAIPDIRSIEIIGEYDREFHVSLNPARLRRYGVTFTQAAEAVRSAGVRIPTGQFTNGAGEFMLDAGKRLDSQEDVLNIIVRRDGDGNFIRIRDLAASARMSHRDPSVVPSVNGKDALRLKIVKETSGNAVDISKQVKAAARAFEKAREKDGVRVAFTHDSTIEINDSVNTLGGNLILGMSLVFVLLWVTLGFRNSLLTAVGIPFAFLCSLIIMKIGGVTLNTISLFAFVLVTGIMVDDAVIILENIFRHLQMGKSRKAAVIEGTAEVMPPVISSALTTMLAFIPMLIMSGSTGEFFAEIPKTVTYALIASLFEALFILPIHILDWGPKTVAGEKTADEEEDPFHHLRAGVFAPFWRIYRWLMTRFLNHKLLTLCTISVVFLIAAAVLVLSITGLHPLIQVKFFPGNYFRYHVTLALPAGAPIEATDAAVRDLSSFIMSLGTNQAQSASGAAGYYEDKDYQRHQGHNYGEIVVTLPDESVRDFPENPANDPMQHLEYMRRRIHAHVEATYADAELKPFVTVFEESDGPPTGKPVNIRVTGLTTDDALKAADALKATMAADPELSDMVDLEDDRPFQHRIVKYLPRQEAAAVYGLTPGAVTALAAGALNGRRVGTFRTADEEVDLMVRLARVSDPVTVGGAGLSDPYDLLNVPVIEHSAAPVLLRDIVDIQYAMEPSKRARYKGKPTVTITSDIRAGSKLSPARVQVAASRLFDGMRDRFTGVSLSFGGEFESTSRSYTSLTFAFFIALLGIYLVLASQFNDYFQPMIIISAVPFALIGVVFGLFVTRTVFTVGSFMAIVGLAGVSVNDSLLIIDFINKRREREKPMRDAVIEACAARMRPVLITTVTTMLGLLPMAIGIPRKSISWAPMATAFVAGLSSATILALLIIPVEYEAFEKFRRAVNGRFKKDDADEPDPAAPSNIRVLPLHEETRDRKLETRN